MSTWKDEAIEELKDSDYAGRFIEAVVDSIKSDHYRMAEMDRENAELRSRLDAIEKSSVELLDAIKAHWNIGPDQLDAMTLYLLSFAAGFAREWSKNPPRNGFVYAIGFEGVGEIEIDVHRVDGKSAYKSLREVQAENVELRKERDILSEALNAQTCAGEV